MKRYMLCVLYGFLVILTGWSLSSLLDAVYTGVGIGWMMLFALMCMSGCFIAMFWMRNHVDFGEKERRIQACMYGLASVFVCPWLMLAAGGILLGSLLKKKGIRGARICAIVCNGLGMLFLIHTGLQGKLGMDNELLGLWLVYVMNEETYDLFGRYGLEELWQLIGALGAAGMVFHSFGIYPGDTGILYGVMIGSVLLSMVPAKHMQAYGYLCTAVTGCIVLFRSNVPMGIYGTAVCAALSAAIPYVQAQRDGDREKKRLRIRFYGSVFFLGELFLLYALYGNGTVRFSGYLAMSMTGVLLWLNPGSTGWLNLIGSLSEEEREE